MAYLDEIIQQLTNENESLSATLLKTQVFLHNIGKNDLAQWVKSEINGYPPELSIPEYRKLRTQVVADITNGVQLERDFYMSISHLENDLRNDIEYISLKHPLSTIEGWLIDTNSLNFSFPNALFPELNKRLSISNYYVQKAWRSASKHDVKGILTQIRSRLLDFLLSLKDNLGNVKDDSNDKDKISNIDIKNLFNHAIYGSSINISIGNHNQQNIDSLEIHNDVESLINLLKKIGIPVNEINSLEEAIKVDIKSNGKASWKGKVGSWFINLLDQTGDKMLNVSTDLILTKVGKVLANYIRI